MGLLQLIFTIGGTIAIAMWLLNWLFPPIERVRDRRASLLDMPATPRPIREDAATPSMPTEPLPEAPSWLGDYWAANLRLIAPYLLIWLLSFTLPSLLAAPLNQMRVLTGFPLGYYMGAQGSLLIFIILTFLYHWRMRQLERRYDLIPRHSPEERRRRLRIFATYSGFTLGFALLVFVISQLEQAWRIPVSVMSWFFMLITVGLYALIGLRGRTSQLDEYYVAGRRIPGMLNGLATGSDWMSAASFISMAGAIYLLGYEGLAYITGWTGGYVLLALLLAPYLRKFGQFTIPDFIGKRYPGAGTRVIGAVISIIISFTYVTAQVTGVGIIMSRFLGVNYMLGVIVGLSAVLLCSFLGGMQAITWTQAVQGIIMVIAYLVPVTWLSVKLTGVPLPQIMYGQAMYQIEALEVAQGIQSYSQPFNDWTPWNFLALTLCLMLGTAGMPHILVRFYTVPSMSEARSSVSWALAWIAILYLTAPAYAAFSRLEILQEVVDRPIAQLPQWAENWAKTGLLSIADAPEQGGNGDGRLQYHELQIDQDLIVLATPEIAGLPATVVALVAAGGMAAALSTADGLLMVIASAVAHDIFHRTLNPKATPRERLLLGRLMVLSAAVLAALTAIQRLAIIVQMVAWAFSLAAATFFPVLVLGIFWKGATSRGAASGMISGLMVTLGYMLLNYTFPDWGIFGINHSAAGIFGVPVNFFVTWVVSRLDIDQPTPASDALVDSLRHPEENHLNP
ncbi:SSS family solute/sodium (Na+) symporter [Oscillochloris trichoides DG-6]|uniref:SSS family solute/sodium (Na+) symporter n=1 Tax=Oscillochloris trichoides DG-6 TaxID=765420 RepID=E1IAI4_9CHLR|nr:VC_2705 family sodium/solute symporter [Oscillochloris trichoides]EFO81758.1 SSS family solute/sodium (Na+) symporter [Oscillochloris trichoides DG-6]